MEGENLDLSEISPVLVGEFSAGNGWQEKKLDKPTEGRYLCLEAIDAIDGKDIAAIAELYVLDDKGERISREPWIVDYADSEDVKTKAIDAPISHLTFKNQLIGVQRQVNHSLMLS